MRRFQKGVDPHKEERILSSKETKVKKIIIGLPRFSRVVEWAQGFEIDSTRFFSKFHNDKITIIKNTYWEYAEARGTGGWRGAESRDVEVRTRVKITHCSFLF